MSTTSIEWTDRTWNPVTGCDRVSPGCDNCYALTMAKRLKAMGSAHYQADGNETTSGPGFGVKCHEDALDLPMKWRKPARVFVNSMSDLFHPGVYDSFIAAAWATMALTPRHTYQVLTKRPKRMATLLSDSGVYRNDVDEWASGLYFNGDVYGDVTGFSSGFRNWLPAYLAYTDLPLPNVWLGTSIEDDRYSFRADHLRATPAAVRFLSLEPLLGPLPSLDLTGIDWVVVGGESGPGARPMHPDWVRDIRDRCVAAGIPFFFKQWGAWWPDIEGFRYAEDGTKTTPMHNIGKKRAGRLLDGRTWDEFPR